MTGDRRSAGIAGPVDSAAAWLLAVMPAALLWILLVRQVWDPDIFWQLKLGEIILLRGEPVTHELFAATHLGEPTTTISWLGQILMAQVRLWWGWTGLRICDAALWLGGFLTVAAACRHRGAAALGIVICLALGFWISYPTASVRPQSFAVFAFGILLAVLRLELKPWRTTWLCVPLFVLWQNLHPSVSLGAAVVGTYAGIDWLRWLLKRGAPPWETSLLTVAAALAIFATPDGWSVLQLSALNAQMSASVGATEWLPLWHSIHHGALRAVALICAVTIGLLAFNRSRIDPREIAVAIVFFVMTALANRFVLFWVIALIPVHARAVKPLPEPHRVPAFVTAVLLLVTAVATPLQQPTYFSSRLPLAAIERLHARNIEGTIFNHFPWGGPLVDRGYPQWRISLDGRYYRYTPEEWRFYFDERDGKVPLAEIERRYTPVAYMLDPDWDRFVIAELRADPRWQSIWSDKDAVVFVPRTATATSPAR